MRSTRAGAVIQPLYVRGRTAQASCSREQASQSDYIVILKIFRSSSKTLHIVTASRVPLGRGREVEWSV